MINHHKECEHYEGSLKAAKRYYQSCMLAAIAIATMMAFSNQIIPGWITLICGIGMMFFVRLVGQAVENRAYLLAHERIDKQE